MKKIRNKYINKETQINFVENTNYKSAYCIDSVLKLRNYLVRQFAEDSCVVNNSTGMKAIINRKTIRKMLFPGTRVNMLSSHYIDNLNAGIYLKELFKNSIYVDTLKPMKNKVHSIHEQGFHHFVAPLKMKGECYKAFITVRQKLNSNILYVISVKLFKFDYMRKSISAKELIEDVSIWDYDKSDYNYYSYADFVEDNLEYTIQKHRGLSLDAI